MVGAVQTSLMAGFDKIISFDMGGTSTDVAHYNGNMSGHLKRKLLVRLTPMMAIHTSQLGRSILQFDGSRVDQSQLGRIRDQLRICRAVP